MPATYEPIATTTLSSTSNGVTFSSIPQTYTDLVLVITGTLNTTNYISLTYNNDTAGNYSYTQMTGNGSSASSSRSANTGYAYTGQLSTSQGLVIFNIQNYANTTTNKTAIARASTAGVETGAWVSLWRNTAAISTIYASSGNGSAIFQSGSTFTLYGIKAA